MLNGFSERFVVDSELLGDIFSRGTGLRQLFCLVNNFLVDNGGATTTTRSVEGLDTFFAVFFYTAQDAVLRDSEGTYDLDLSAGSLADKLRREHLK